MYEAMEAYLKDRLVVCREEGGDDEGEGDEVGH